MAGELGRGQLETLVTLDDASHAVDMNKKDDMFDNLDSLPGLDPEATVDGGVDPSKDDDNCTGGACKI
ncbi:hypothetical protein MLDJOKPK_00206 [Salmonella phage SPAsTU]|nr:hypothetical protein MLDJOKPK_00206 [Salmonella phage SPAsTU]